MSAFSQFSTPDLKVISKGLELAENKSRVIAKTMPRDSQDDLAIVEESLRFAGDCIRLRNAINEECDKRNRNEQN